MQRTAKKITRILSVLVASISIVSCASKDEVSSEPAEAATGMSVNSGYSNSSVRGPVPQNPNVRLPSDISGSSSVTITHGSRSQKYIALTFDDGPHPVNTPRLLDILRRRNVKATFYVIGNLVDRYPHIVKRIVDEGHEIGNHTWTHPNLKNLGDSNVRSELDRTRDAIVKACGVQPLTMRPPYGSLSSAQRNWIYRDYGYPTIMWDVDPLDWKKPGSGVVASRLINGTRNGSILLVHDLHAGSVSAMPQTVDTLLRKGYQFVTVSQLIAAQGTVAVR
ncbi:polysaccharide deacetylase family protein [Rubritalea spongiae]|uniref:Polysaccharide deacetylase family protein n=1 Tax=Rubritalea spongiae TaxID=430797 RepID=A0ABW5E2U1_9BACT